MPRAGLSPQRLAAVGAELADERGFDAVTPSEVARRVGVRVPSLYVHVRGADDLRARISAYALDELADRAEVATAGSVGREALVGLATAYRDYARDHPGRWAASSQLRGAAAGLARAAGERHAALSRQVLDGYDPVGHDERVHRIRLLGSMLRGFIDLESGGGFERADPPADASWERMLDLLDTMLGARSTEGVR